MKIVLLSGKQGSGKTSIQSQLVDQWQNARWAQGSGNRAIAVNFADVLYFMHDAVRTVGDRYGIPRTYPKDGLLLQVLGTQWARARNPNVWVDCTHARMASMAAEAGTGLGLLFVIGDCRFENEFHAFPSALRVRFEAPESVREARCTQWRTNTQHESEVGLDHMADKFDLRLATDVIPVSGCVDMIIAQLQKNTWTQKRNP